MEIAIYQKKRLLQEFDKGSGSAFFIPTCPQKRLIFFDIPNRVSIGGNNFFRLRISVVQPLFKPCPELRHVCVLPEGDIAGKVV